jgi:hypothetical protein
LIDITGRVTVGGEAQGKKACDEEKMLREAPAVGSHERFTAMEDVNLHFNGSEDLGSKRKRSNALFPTAGQGGNPGLTDHHCGKRAVTSTHA